MTKAFPLTAALLSALSLTPAMAQDAVTADTVVARVGETEFTMGHVLVMRAQLPDRVLNLPDDVLLAGIVDQLIDQYLLGKSVDVSDLPKAIQLQLENESRGANASAALQQVLEDAVTADALQAAYDEQYGDAEPSLEYNAAHILLDTAEDAQEVVTLLADGADFAELAAERSTGPTGPRGGDLGWFGEGVMIPAFFEAVQALEVGAVSEPVETQFGFHVITLKETRDVPPPTIDEVRATLGQEIQQAAVEARVTELREAAVPEILLDGIDPAELRNDALLGE